MKDSPYLSVFSLVIILTVFQACGDDPASSEESTPPELPELEEISVDDSFFRDNEPADPQNEQYAAYLYSQEGVIMISSELQTILELPKTILTEAIDVEASENNGTWTWEFQSVIQGELIGGENDISAEIRLTAQAGDTDNETVWNLFISADDSPVGPLNDFNLCNITANPDETSGTFEMFNPENPETPVLDVAWNVLSEDEKTLNIFFIEESEQGSGTNEINYTQTGTEFSLSSNDIANNTEIIISWNISTGTGSIDTLDGLFCWDENLLITEC